MSKTTKPAQPQAGANQPVTWGELFLILEKRPRDLQRAVLEKIMELDAA